ncbi:MAG: tetratricopeptide repeat protein [Candidatus Omnitrophota bacterium]
MSKLFIYKSFVSWKLELLIEPFDPIGGVMKAIACVILFLLLIQFPNIILAQDLQQTGQREKLLEQRANINKLAAQGKYDEAIAGYTDILTANPDNAEAYFQRAVIYDMQHKYDEASRDLIKSIEIDPSQFTAYALLVAVFVMKKDYDHALLYANKEIELTPNNYGGYLVRGSVYYEQGNFDSAIADYNKALEIYPDQASKQLQDTVKVELATIYFIRAKAFLAKKDYDKSWDDVHKAESLGDDRNFKENNPQFLDDLRKASGKDK